VTGAAPAITRDELEKLGLVAAGEEIEVVRLAGGVSSDIFRIDAGGRTVVIKRALAKLRVADEWLAPTSRNRHEADWFETVAGILPGAVPKVIARDDRAGLFAMEFFPPDQYAVWKGRLRDGDVDPAFAAETGRHLAAIHAHTAGDRAIAERFATAEIFHAIRLEPYFEQSARRHPELAETLFALSRETLATNLALVHGDVSPKNILVGPHGPVFLDAECAWYGDPAFDLAFCLNHLLLKCLWNRSAAPRLIEAFASLADAYRAGVSWEPLERLERRAARMLAAFLLARVDGKSPVEYLDEPAREFVRKVSVPLVASPLKTPHAIAQVWALRLEL
jgi:aminoglycoside phosphotransferase (APT) family kinase protein